MLSSAPDHTMRMSDTLATLTAAIWGQGQPVPSSGF